MGFFRWLLLAMSILPTHLWARLTVSTLRGTAADQSGAVVINARIRVVQQETNLARGMNYTVNINKPQVSLTPFAQSRRPYPQSLGGSIGKNDGALNYNALSIEGRRKMGQLSFDAHWTWTSNYLNYLCIEDPYAPLRWSHDQYSSNFRAVDSAAWTMAFGHGKKFLTIAPRPVDLALGGWRAAWVSIAETGQFFTPSFSGVDTSNTNTAGGRPGRIADGNLPPEKRTLEHWFDASTFVVPAPGRFGNASPFSLVRPGITVHNLSVSKNFKARESFNTTFMVAAQVLLNYPAFASPAANISSAGTVGVISMELRLRVQFR